jgi:glycosyltransferase involved in cell wall biosynthesis
MRIVIVVEEFDPEKGYLEYYLAKELETLGNDVSVVTFASSNFSKIRLKEGFDVINVPYFSIIQGYHVPNLQGIVNLFRFMRIKKPDVLHCQPLDSPLSLLLASWKSFFNYKIVGSILTQLNLAFSQWGIKKKMFFSLSRIAVKVFVSKKCAIVYAKTQELAKLLSRSYDVPLRRFQIVPLGSDPKLFKFDLDARTRFRKRLGFSENDVVLVYSGKLDSTKGLDILIKALAPIARNTDEIKLLIIGKGDPLFVNYLNQLISKVGLEKKVVLHPWVNKALIPSLFSASDIGVWPGLSSISIVDAASIGLPLVIARVPVETFAIEGNNGFSFQPGNVTELRKHLQLLIQDSALRKVMGRNSRSLVEQKLNWTSIGKSYLETYTSVCEVPI